MSFQSGGRIDSAYPLPCNIDVVLCDICESDIDEEPRCAERSSVYPRDCFCQFVLLRFSEGAVVLDLVAGHGGRRRSGAAAGYATGTTTAIIARRDGIQSACAAAAMEKEILGG